MEHVTIASYICSDQAERHKNDLDDGDPTYLDRACRGRALQTRRHQAAASRLHSGEEVVEGQRQAARSLSSAHEARLVRTLSGNLMNIIVGGKSKCCRITSIKFQKQEPLSV